MKKVIVLITAISFLFVGCIDYSSTVKLNADGSGTIEETVLLSGAIIQMMSSFSESFADSTSEPEEFSLFDEEELKTQASKMGEGIKYLSGEKITISGSEGYKAMFSFDDISKVKLSENPDEKISMDDMGGEVEVIEEPEFITFNFSKGSPANLEINFPEPDLNEEPEEEIEIETGEESTDKNEMMEEQMKMFLKDFRISIDMVLEGEIEETNASFVEGNKITLLEMNFNELLDNPEMMKNFSNKEPESMSEIKELIKNIPGFKIEMNRKVFVKFDK